MRTRVLSGVAGSIAAAAAFVVAAPVANAAGSTVPHLVGSAAGSTVSALSGAVTSGPTAASSVNTLTPGRVSSNAVAQANVAKVLNLGAVTTQTATESVAGGLAVVAHARTAGVNLLNGAVTVQAVDTTATSTLVGTTVASTVHTDYVGLSIGGKPVKATSKPNTVIRVPGVVKVVLNYEKTTHGASAGSATGAGLLVTVLNGAGAIVTLNPVHSSITQVGQGYAPLTGFAYATRVFATVDGAVNVYSGPTGATAMPPAGTHGRNVSNNTAAVNLPNVATAGAAGSTANGVVGNLHSEARESVSIAKVNLLGGLIRADALTGTADVSLRSGHPPVATANCKLVNLVIDGHAIPVNAAPNSTISVGNLATVYLNRQVLTGRTASVVVLEVVLTTAGYGLPAGADVQVGVAGVGLDT